MELQGKRIAILAEDNYEDLELWYPLLRMREAGAEVKVVGMPGVQEYHSKHGILGLTKTAALEYATEGIRVNAVCPGVIRTPMVERATGGDPEVEAQLTAIEPVGRMGKPEEVAEAVVWLCSDAASFVTGHSMIVDGGLVAR